MLRKCICKNRYQDKRYGKQMRVKNPLPKVENKPRQYRCTVCGLIT